MRILLLPAALAFSALSSIASAEAPFSFANTPGKLPKNVVPEAYEAHLVPDLRTLTFRGDETIHIRVKSRASRLVLNALEIGVNSAVLSGKQIAKQTLTPVLDADQQTLSFDLAKPLKPGRYDLVLAYTGVINAQAQGLYYDKYPTPSGEKVMLGTQMEATDARRMLPSWDEPSFRATFQLAVDLPSNLAVFSNTPSIRSEALPGDLTRTTFRTTPKMASYLVVLVAGELERIAGSQDGTEIGVVTTEGKIKSAQYTLEASKELLHYYNGYFGVPFPLPKLDQIGTPGGFGGAMENWGGIVYNETALLFDPEKSGAATRVRVYSVIAHEMAHQWFGDLVTMAWWDNLWLNEGFASWMSTKAIDELHPDWDYWLAANEERERAMSLDARKTTHPIQQPVKTESEANDAFDEITYLKGQSFLRMLETYLGADTFRTGIRAYMLQHRYSNTTTADLWAALEKASGKPVSKIAQVWTSQPGFPVVKVDAVCENGERRITLTQEQFKTDDDEPSLQLWNIPVSIGEITRPGEADSEYTLLDTRSATITRKGCDGVLVVDPAGVGYYRVEYSPGVLQPLVENFEGLPAGARLKLLSDSWALVTANRADLAQYLDLVSKLGNEPKAAIWKAVTDNLVVLDGLARDEPARDVLRRFSIGILAPKFAMLGWNEKLGESFPDSKLRGELGIALGKLGDPAVIAEARERFQRFLADPSSLSSAIVDPVIAVAGRNADETIYDALLKLAKAAQTTEEKSRYYRALTSAEDPKLAEKSLPLALDPETPLLFANRIPYLVGDDHVVMAWNYAMTNFSALDKNLGSFERNGYLVSVTRSSTDAAMADELEAFTKANLPAEAATETHRGADAIRLRARLKARLLPQAVSALSTAKQP